MESPTTERAWAEYLAWVRGSSPGEYEATEARAWSRLEGTLIALRLRPYTMYPRPAPSVDPRA